MEWVIYPECGQPVVYFHTGMGTPVARLVLNADCPKKMQERAAKRVAAILDELNSTPEVL